MGLKQHIGILVMLAMAGMLGWAWRDDLRAYEWFIPLFAALMVWSVGEAVGWAAYYFFFS